MDNERSYAGKSSIAAQSKTMQMILLSTSLFGLQFVWGVEQVYFMNYMVSIGLSKVWISLVWLAGPLSGLLVQPIVGALSDSCQSSYGRRRPFLVAGAAITVLCLFMVAWTHDIAYAIFPEHLAHGLTISLVVIGVYLLDFAVNFVQAAGRALIVDSLSTDEQEAGNAYAAKLVATGHLLGYFLGYLNLQPFLFFLGNSQFKIVVFLASSALIAGVAVTCRSVQERVLVDRGGGKAQSLGGIMRSLWHVFKTLSTRIKLICAVQVLSWHAWFPFLFYSSTWIGEVYSAQHSDHDIDADTRSRMGSFGLLLFSIVTLICSFALPKFAVSTDPDSKWPKSGLPDLAQLWGIGQCIFALAMCSTVFIRSTYVACAVIASCGFSWSLTAWAPFSLIGEEITKSNNVRVTSAGRDTVTYTNVRDSDSDDELDRPLTSTIPLQNDDAGSILGIHNIAICVPQFIISFISSIVFKLLQGTDYNAIGVILTIGGGFAFLSSLAIFKYL